jgi:hypothetical protein
MPRSAELQRERENATIGLLPPNRDRLAGIWARVQGSDLQPAQFVARFSRNGQFVVDSSGEFDSFPAIVGSYDVNGDFSCLRERERWSRKLITAVVVSLLAVLGLTMTMVLPSGAQTEPPPISVELLTPSAEFTDDVGLKVRYRLDGSSRRRVVNLKDASRTVVARTTVQPGARFPWHTHPGPVMVNVAQGELVYVRANDCVERPYPMGTAFVDSGKKTVHTAFNPTDGVTVVYATFYDVPETGPLTITEGVEEPDDCSLEVGSHSSH